MNEDIKERYMIPLTDLDDILKQYKVGKDVQKIAAEQTEEYFAFEVKKQDIGRVLSTLSANECMVPSFLKRVNSTNGTKILLSKNRSDVEFLPDDYKLAELISVEVPVRAPESVAEQDIMKKSWPVSFHPSGLNRDIEKTILDTGLVNPTCLNYNVEAIERNGLSYLEWFTKSLKNSQPEIDTETALKAPYFYMLQAKNLAKEAELNGRYGSAAIVVDPWLNKIIAYATDNTERVSKNITAKYSIDNELEYIEPTEESSKLQHSVMRVIEEVSKLNNLIDDCHTFKPYICSGLHLYAYPEPCIMCSMGAVHSRFSRLYFSGKNHRNNGGLEERCNLHCCNVNHKYEVIKVNI